jgi:mRNA interferase RelE/StbE
MYNIQVARKPKKVLKELPDDYKEKIKARLKELEKNIKPHGAIHLIGKKNCYRIRIGPFRVQYQFFEDEKLVLVYKITKRSETTYKSLLL